MGSQSLHYRGTLNLGIMQVSRRGFNDKLCRNILNWTEFETRKIENMSSNNNIYNKLLQGVCVLILLAMNGCIEPYAPEINESAVLLVIEGSVIREAEFQTVTVSRTTPLDEGTYDPVQGCSVWVTNGNGLNFNFQETSAGVYTVSIAEEYLELNEGFSLSVVTPNGNEYQSDYESILLSSEIDSLYYAESYLETSMSSSELGLQFYCDLKADASATQHYMWKQVETYEVHTLPFSGMIYDEELEVVDFGHRIDSIAVCYPTGNVSGFTCASTKNLTVNEKKMIPLKYVPHDSPKLNYNYSDLVYQYSLSDAAYDYWSRIQSLSEDGGGLYQSQPYNVRSNICNIHDESEVVLGYFWASSRCERRLNFKGPMTDIDPLNSCVPDTLDIVIERYEEGRYFDPPWYLVDEPADMGTLWLTTYNICFDCRIKYGSNVKPDFFE